MAAWEAWSEVTRRASSSTSTKTHCGLAASLNQDGTKSLDRVQQLLLQGDLDQAHMEANLGLSGTPSSMRQYMPVGDFQIVFQNQSATPADYERYLETFCDLRG